MDLCRWFYANVESLTPGKLDDREWILKFLNRRYFNNIIPFQKLETTSSPAYQIYIFEEILFKIKLAFRIHNNWTETKVLGVC